METIGYRIKKYRKDLYKRYIECRQNYSIDEDALYYWVYSNTNSKYILFTSV